MPSLFTGTDDCIASDDLTLQHGGVFCGSRKLLVHLRLWTPVDLSGHLSNWLHKKVPFSADCLKPVGFSKLKKYKEFNMTEYDGQVWCSLHFRNQSGSLDPVHKSSSFKFLKKMPWPLITGGPATFSRTAWWRSCCNKATAPRWGNGADVADSRFAVASQYSTSHTQIS